MRSSELKRGLLSDVICITECHVALSACERTSRRRSQSCRLPECRKRVQCRGERAWSISCWQFLHNCWPRDSGGPSIERVDLHAWCTICTLNNDELVLASTSYSLSCRNWHVLSNVLAHRYFKEWCLGQHSHIWNVRERPKSRLSWKCRISQVLSPSD